MEFISYSKREKSYRNGQYISFIVIENEKREAYMMPNFEVVQTLLETAFPNEDSFCRIIKFSFFC
jgi:hypothetical protein